LTRLFFHKRFFVQLAASICLALIAGCGSVDPGERVLPRWQKTPDYVVFSEEIRPGLVTSCATSQCHGRDTSFSLQVGNDQSDVLADYYTVLAFCDLDFPLTSALLSWGFDVQAVHPGGKVLSIDDRDRIIDWLEDAL